MLGLTWCSFHRKTGMLSVAPKSSGVLQRYQKSMENCDAPYEMLSSHQLHMRYPQFRLTSDYEGQLDCEAGVLKAERALLAMQVKIDLCGPFP